MIRGVISSRVHQMSVQSSLLPLRRSLSQTPVAAAIDFPDFGLKDKVVIVTAASAGLGKASAEAFAKAGTYDDFNCVFFTRPYNVSYRNINMGFAHIPHHVPLPLNSPTVQSNESNQGKDFFARSRFEDFCTLLLFLCYFLPIFWSHHQDSRTSTLQVIDKMSSSSESLFFLMKTDEFQK